MWAVFGAHLYFIGPAVYICRQHYSCTILFRPVSKSVCDQALIDAYIVNLPSKKFYSKINIVIHSFDSFIEKSQDVSMIPSNK